MLLPLLLMLTISGCSKQYKSIEEEYFSILDRAKEINKSALINYFDIIEDTIEGISDEGPLISAFIELDKIYRKIPTKSSTFEEQDRVIRSTYLERFMIFQNLLFINKKGDVFYSLDTSGPVMENLFSNKYADSNLSQSLKDVPETIAVDFDFFNSEDASAFFVYPIYSTGNHIGWCAFQYLSNSLNMLFNHDDSIGQTGEVFLVNKDRYLLTDSAFTKDDSILKIHLSQENIERKFALQNGHLLVNDYRGYDALSSFEVVSVMDLEWLLIAKMDLDEILTLEFQENSSNLYSEIRNTLRDVPHIYLSDKPEIEYSHEVHLDQYKRISNRETIYTHGVSTCTVAIITLPDQFSYMAHISAYDNLYGGNKTDLLGSILSRIRRYEIPDSKLRDLKIYIITPEISFSENILKKLINEKILLSQIYMIKNPEALFANIFHDLNDNSVNIQWNFPDEEVLFENTREIFSIGDIIRTILINDEYVEMK